MVVTENLYLAAYATTHGGMLKRITVSKGHGRSTALFEIDSPWADKLSDEWHAGTASVNVAAYLQQLEGLKDQLFAALKKTETKRDSHAFVRQG